MPKSSPAPVPQTRLGRIAQIGLAAGEFAVGAAAEALKRFARGDTSSAGEALLSASNARRLAARLAKLRGAAMKIGQLVSLQGEDLLPPEFAEALAVLRAQASPMPLPQLRRMLGREYGKGWERKFATFDDEPVAAASIGQVHRATTPDGRDLALKIQYPGVARSIASDVDNVAALLRLFHLLPPGFDVGSMAAEAKRQLSQEADYVSEGALPGTLRAAGRRRAEALRSARALGPDDVARHGHGFRGGRAARRARRRAARTARCRRIPAPAPSVSRAVRVPRHADGSQLRELPVSAGKRPRGAARFRSDATLRRGLRRKLRAHHPLRDRRRSQRGRPRGDPDRLRRRRRLPGTPAGGGRRHLPRLRAASTPRPVRLREVGPAFARERARIRSHVPARAPPLTSGRDPLSSSQARGLVSAVGPPRRARRCTRARAAVPARRRKTQGVRSARCCSCTSRNFRC